MENPYLKKMFEALQNLYVGEIVETKDATYIFGDIIDDTIWNVVLPKKFLNLLEIEDAFLKRNLVPAIYSDIDIAEKNWGYKSSFTDSWMKKSLSGKKTEVKHDVEICNDKNIIIDLIMKGFSTNDPNDPYGDISPVSWNACKKSWQIAKRLAKRALCALWK